VDAIAFTTATGLTAASQAEMEAGTEAGMRAMSPLRVAQAIAAQADMVYEARATNTVFAAGDKNKFIEYTGSFTQTFGSAASLGADWKVVLKNAFTDSVYLTPSGGATIDGVADFLMYPGEARLLQCDGTNFHSVILQGFRMLPTTSGFFFEPPGYLGWDTYIQAPGGGGGSGAVGINGSGGGGGGAGAWAQAFIRASTAGTSHTITVGAAGTGGAAVSGATGNAGVAGGASSFGALLVATGGTAGAGGNNTSADAVGGTASTVSGNVATPGTAGGKGMQSSPVAGTISGVWAATGGGGGSGITGGAGGDAAAGGTSGLSTTLIAAGTAGATAGTRPGGAGNAPTTNKRRGGTGGGGGASHASEAGAAGGAGAHGGGGGGGSGATGAVNSGAGGAGGAGYFEIVGVF
jgi:hypothetical protein